MPRPLPPLLLVLAAMVLGGCGTEAESEDPGIRGPVVFRLWDRQARARGLPPTVVRADGVRQATLGFDDLEMVPVLVRRPLPEGVVWIHAPTGHLQGQDRDQQLSLSGPVHLSGVIRGVPVCGSAARAEVPRGQQVLRLFDVRLVRGGMLMTAPSVDLTDRLMTSPGPVRTAPGAPALCAALGSVP